jgi:hypothetical protein
VPRSARALVLAASLLTTACGLEQLWRSEGGPAGGPAITRAAADSTCPAAVAPGQPFELPPDVVAPDYPEAPLPAELPLLRLDLAAGRVHTYTSETTNKGPNPFDPGKSEYTVRERIQLKGAGQHLGRFLAYGTPPAGFPDADRGEQLQALIVDVGDDTTIRGRVSQELELQLRLPLPPAPLAPGAPVARPVRFPIDDFGAYFYARGLMTFKLDKYVTVDGHRGVQYRVKLDIHDVDQIPGRPRSRTVAFTAHAAVVFDLDDRSFVAVRSHTTLKTDMFPPTGSPDELARPFTSDVLDSRTRLDRDPANTTPPTAQEPPVPAARCGVPVSPGAAFTVPPALAAAVTYPDAPAPAAPPQVRWDFTPGKVHAYASTEVDATPNPFVAGSTETTTLATRQFHAQGDGRARYVSYERIDDPAEPTPKADALLPVILVDVAPDTTVDGRISQEADLRLRFPVPPAPLVAGAPIAVPYEFPFNVQGALYYGVGTTTYQLDRHVTVDGHLAVQYSVRTEVRGVPAPPEVPGVPDIAFEHHAVAVFDTVDNNFVAVHTLETRSIDLTRAIPADKRFALGGPDATTTRTTTLRDPSRIADPVPRKP